MSNNSPLATHFTDGVLSLTLNRPEKRNSLSEAMIGALHGAIEDAGANPDVHAVIINAAGHVFSAGHDLKEMKAARGHDDKGRAYYKDIMARCANMMMAIVKCPKPVIAEIEGVATAAGCQLVASCDLAVAGEKARFCTPGVHIGLFCSTPMVALTRNISRKHAMEMLLLGEMIGAEKAAGMGLVNRVCAAGEAGEEALKMAKIIAGKSSITIKYGKDAFYNQIEMSLEDAYRHAAKVMVENMLAHDAEEGINAFVEKRKPQWQS